MQVAHHLQDHAPRLVYRSCDSPQRDSSRVQRLQLNLQSLTSRVNRHSFSQMAHMTTQFSTHPGRGLLSLPHRDCRISRNAALVAVPARRQRGARSRTSCFGATLDEFNSTAPSAVGMLTQAVSLVAVAAGAWYAARLANAQENAEPRQECGVCNGTGMVPCICRRWSDSDVGCATCNGRGMMACNSCGGGGTAVPITAKLIIRRDENDMNRYTGR